MFISRTMALVVLALTVPDFGNDERSGSRECGVGLMNNIIACVDEIVLNDIVYS